MNLSKVINQKQRAKADWLANGLDRPAKIKYEPSEMDPSQRLRATAKPPGWWLVFCEHDVPLAGPCKRCRRK